MALQQFIFCGIPEFDWIQVRDGYKAKFSPRPEATLIDIFWNYCQWFKDLSGFGPRTERPISVGEWDRVLKIHIEISRGPKSKKPHVGDDDNRYGVDHIGGVSEIMATGEQVKPDEGIEMPDPDAPVIPHLDFSEDEDDDPTGGSQASRDTRAQHHGSPRRVQPISGGVPWALGGGV